MVDFNSFVSDGFIRWIRRNWDLDPEDKATLRYMTRCIDNPTETVSETSLTEEQRESLGTLEKYGFIKVVNVAADGTCDYGICFSPNQWIGYDFKTRTPGRINEDDDLLGHPKAWQADWSQKKRMQKVMETS